MYTLPPCHVENVLGCCNSVRYVGQFTKVWEIAPPGPPAVHDVGVLRQHHRPAFVDTYN